MRFAYFGTPYFAYAVLDRLLEAGLRPELVATGPDAASKRGSEVWPSAVAQRAVEADLPLIKPSNLHDPALAARLRALELDCVILVAYGNIIPASLLEIPAQGWINVHASLLPRWRGAAPIQRAILAGDAQTGVSIMRMERGLDTGPYCAQAAVTIGDRSLGLLEDLLAARGAELLTAELPKIIAATALWQEQDEAQVTYADKINKRDLELDPGQSAEINVRRVRASSNSAPARFTLFSGTDATQLRALRAELRPLSESQDPTPQGGSLGLCADHLALYCGSGYAYCAVTHLQPAGKSARTAADFLRGFRSKEPLSWR
ncbi:MAG: methionyl-tRNA formyltransferase [Actinomycetia bacterium]|nr:methionyl-tRNA formyltransferase [Actinomycetes bacterium]